MRVAIFSQGNHYIDFRDNAQKGFKRLVAKAKKELKNENKN